MKIKGMWEATEKDFEYFKKLNQQLREAIKLNTIPYNSLNGSKKNDS